MHRGTTSGSVANHGMTSHGTANEGAAGRREAGGEPVPGPRTGPSGGPAPRRRALLSVADKLGVVALGRALHEQGWEIASTGSTAAVLREAGVPVTAVSDVTGFPELLDGRVKTLHPAIHAGILARRRRPGDMAALAEHGIVPIDLVAVNLYPFEEAAAAGATGDELLEQVDIGGPALIRAAAKNWPDVTVLVDPGDYPRVLTALREEGGVPARLRRELAVKAFAHTAYYDAVIAITLARESHAEERTAATAVTPPGDAPGPAGSTVAAAAAGAAVATGPASPGDLGAVFRALGGVGREEPWPERVAVPLRRVRSLRYGENPHQAAALYRVALPGAGGQAAVQGESGNRGTAAGAGDPDPGGPGPVAGGALSVAMPDIPPPGGGIAGARQLMGKELSYNNLQDADAAWRAVWDFEGPAAVAVKHATPCGIASAATLAEAFRLARDADPESIFGGIVALNRPLDAATAELLADIFLEVVIAPAVAPEALERLSARKNLRVLVADPATAVPSLDVRGIGGGLLIQEADPPGAPAEPAGWRVVTRRQPEAAQLDVLRFAWRAVKHCRSNAIVVAGRAPGGGLRTLGIGAGQTSRVQAVAQALARAGGAAAGAVLASDAFFPFPDSVERAAAAGVAAIIQPGGSVRDGEVIAAADRHGIAMVFTGVRHFRH